MRRTHPHPPAETGEQVNFIGIVFPVDRVQDHRGWLCMHICKCSHLKGSIRVTLSRWQLKGPLFSRVSQRLMNVPMPVSYEPRAQVENCMKNIMPHIVARTNTDCSVCPLTTKWITCDWDYRLVALLEFLRLKESHQGTIIKSFPSLAIKNINSSGLWRIKGSFVFTVY